MVEASFSGEPQAVWLTQKGAVERDMRLTHNFWYRDPDGVLWQAPADVVVDGASIPKALWALVGSPYTGDYRRASIVHDVACRLAAGDSDKRRAADRMFYHACRTGGCTVAEATLLYLGVRIGAHWPSVAAWREGPDDQRPRLERAPRDRRIEADFQLAAQEVLAPGEIDDIFVIEQRADAALSRVTGLDLRGR